jgi:peptide/nickel transport system permease protein
LVVGGIIVGVVALSAVLAPWIAGHDPLKQNTRNRLQRPALLAAAGPHLLGTDALGRDILSRILHGGRVSLALGGAAVAVAGSLGVVLGLVAGYYGRGIDELLTRLADVQLAFPVILLAVAIVAVLGTSLPTLIAALSLSGWVVYARTVRGEVLSLREREFVAAARAHGAGDGRILFRHILPNTLPPVLVIATVQLATMIVLESALSFFGLGTPPPTPTWGGMLAEGRDYLGTAWWVATFPGLAISLTVLGVNLLGETLRDLVDPALRD